MLSLQLLTCLEWCDIGLIMFKRTVKPMPASLFTKQSCWIERMSESSTFPFFLTKTWQPKWWLPQSFRGPFFSAIYHWLHLSWIITDVSQLVSCAPFIFCLQCRCKKMDVVHSWNVLSVVVVFRCDSYFLEFKHQSTSVQRASASLEVLCWMITWGKRQDRHIS